MTLAPLITAPPAVQIHAAAALATLLPGRIMGGVVFGTPVTSFAAPGRQKKISSSHLSSRRSDP